MNKIPSYVLFATVALFLVFIITNSVTYNGPHGLDLGHSFSLTLGTLIAVLIILGLREIPFFKPKGGEDEKALGLYVLVVIAGVLCELFMLREASIGSYVLCQYMGWIVTVLIFVMSLYHQRYGIAMALVTGLFPFYVGTTGLIEFLRVLLLNMFVYVLFGYWCRLIWVHVFLPVPKKIS